MKMLSKYLRHLEPIHIDYFKKSHNIKPIHIF